jgi:hypothetical protein
VPPCDVWVAVRGFDRYLCNDALMLVICPTPNLFAALANDVAQNRLPVGPDLV